uniref:Uncharacterized protein n=1 Tax=Arundo donax TaxID=35708 RepID=A0A0A9A0H3_ARUDO
MSIQIYNYTPQLINQKKRLNWFADRYDMSGPLSLGSGVWSSDSTATKSEASLSLVCLPVRFVSVASNSGSNSMERHGGSSQGDQVEDGNSLMIAWEKHDRAG